MTAPLRSPIPLGGTDADWLRRDALVEYAGLIASLAVSLEEAAMRGSDTLAAFHLRQIVTVAKAASQTMAEIGGAP
jgi:hypothetical protein